MSQSRQQQYKNLFENCCIGGKVFGPCTECAGSPRKYVASTQNEMRLKINTYQLVSVPVSTVKSFEWSADVCNSSQNCQYCLGAGTTWYPCPSCTSYTSTGAMTYGGSSNHQTTSRNAYSSNDSNSSSTEWQGQHGYGSTRR